MYLPRILNLAALEEGVAPSDGPQTSMTASQILFEERRGSLYGELTLVEVALVLEQLPCWACSRKAWTQFAASVRQLSKLHSTEHGEFSTAGCDADSGVHCRRYVGLLRDSRIKMSDCRCEIGVRNEEQ